MKIKTSLLYSIAAGTLLSATVANAQNSATDPVGFHTIKIFGATESGPRFNLVSPGLVNPIEYASGTTSITETTITVEGTPFAGLDFGEVAETVDGNGSTVPAHIAFYVEVTSGSSAGAWANILSNTDNTLTIQDDASDPGGDIMQISAGGAEKIAIRKHVTISDLFGPNNEAGLDAGDMPSLADEISLFANGASNVMFFDDTPGFEGYINAAFDVLSNTPIEPQQAVYVQRKVAGDLMVTRAGHVKVGVTQLKINPGFNALANPRAVGFDDDSMPVFTLGASNLYNGADTANSVDPGDMANLADEVIVPEDNGLFSVYFYDTTKGFEGWINAAFDPKDDVVLDNGKGFLLLRKPELTGTHFIWSVPAEFIAP